MEFLLRLPFRDTRASGRPQHTAPSRRAPGLAGGRGATGRTVRQHGGERAGQALTPGVWVFKRPGF